MTLSIKTLSLKESLMKKKKRNVGKTYYSWDTNYGKERTNQTRPALILKQASIYLVQLRAEN